MLVIIGLGNPEKDYKNTKHNIGFEVINKLAFDHNININKAKHRAHIGEGAILNKRIMLVKPQTYMNLSGECVRDILNYYKLTADNILVVYDDTAIDIGNIRIRTKGSAGGHNGIKNILYQIETDEFLRIRVGIGEKPKNLPLSDYVLSAFKKDELNQMIEGITKATDAIELILRTSATVAMNQYNQKIVRQI